MAHIPKPKPLPWLAPKKKLAQTGRINPNQKFYNSSAWRKLAAMDKQQNPYCVECAKWELKKLIDSTKDPEKKIILKAVRLRVDKVKRGLAEIINGFTEAGLVLARSWALSKRPITDHIVPINQGGAPLNPDNLQTNCSRHHNKKSGKERHLKK